VFSSNSSNAPVSVVSGSTLVTLQTRAGAGRVLGVLDFDGDGKDDLIVHNTDTGAIEVLDPATLSTKSSLVIGSLSLPDRDNFNPFAVSDVTGDGRLELIVGAANGLTVVGSQ
jgi:hypothetical protein